MRLGSMLPTIFEPATMAMSLLHELPQPFSAGLIPLMGGISGASVSSSDGIGLVIGILALLLVLLLSTKYLQSALEFLKPHSAPHLALERPG